jgi:hypothetical protein
MGLDILIAEKVTCHKILHIISLKEKALYNWLCGICKQVSDGRTTWITEKEVLNTDKNRTLNDKNVCQHRPTPVIW